MPKSRGSLSKVNTIKNCSLVESCVHFWALQCSMRHFFTAIAPAGNTVWLAGDGGLLSRNARSSRIYSEVPKWVALWSVSEWPIMAAKKPPDSDRSSTPPTPTGNNNPTTPSRSAANPRWVGFNTKGDNPLIRQYKQFISESSSNANVVVQLKLVKIKRMTASQSTWPTPKSVNFWSKS